LAWGVCMSIKRRLLCTTALTVLGGWVIFTGGAISPAWSAELNLPTKAPPQSNACVPAVDGINGKLSAWGGSFADNALYGGTGSLSLPLGCEFGAQIDGTVASFDNRFLGSVAGHLFWRNPAQGLLGVYGSYTSWDQAGGVRVGYFGPEAAWYAGRWTLEGVAGVESGNSTTALVGGVLTNFDLKTRFFDQVNVAYYLQDNFKVFAGHRYLAGENALALGGEYGIPLSHGVMASLFAEGRIGEDRYRGVWGGVRREVEAGHQAYIVYPVIEESKLELKAAMEEFERLGHEVFSKFKLGLLHGRLSSEEKDDVMQKFRKNEVQILVATTVVEVGVDVPNATVMVIEHAERFGLSQLHQLRGRIGRGAAKSHCVLVGPTRMTDEARARLEAMVRTSNGFEIAETDLELRGPGEFFGTRQAGLPEFRVANLIRDRAVLEVAKTEAAKFAESPDPAVSHEERDAVWARLKQQWQRKYGLVEA